jgi:hypothetical protein
VTRSHVDSVRVPQRCVSGTRMRIPPSASFIEIWQLSPLDVATLLRPEALSPGRKSARACRTTRRRHRRDM